MRVSSQNLNECGSKFWHGRAWIWLKREFSDIRIEWCFGKHATFCHAEIRFGTDDSNSGITASVALPYLFAVWFTVDGVRRVEDECECGFSIHDNAVWFRVLAYSMKSDSKDPWWRKTHCFHFPWALDWYSTEILDHDMNTVVFKDVARSGRRFLDDWEKRKAAEASVTKVYDYEYTRKNGEVQHRKAAVYVDRYTHRARWYPVIPIQKVSTSISVSFNEEIGEGVDSWKGGVTGCGCTIEQGETPLTCLRRMERERKFTR